MNLVKMKFLPELGPQFMELDMIWIGSFKYSLNPSSPIISYLLARSQCFLFPLANRNSSKSLISHLIDQAVLSSAEFPYSANPLKYYSYSEIIGKLKKHYIKSSVAGCQCFPGGTWRTLFQSSSKEMPQTGSLDQKNE